MKPSSAKRRDWRCTEPGCARKFTLRGSMLRHCKEMHGPEGPIRPYECTEEGCGARFTQKGNLKTHLRSVHDLKSGIACPQRGCAKMFTQETGLSKHMMASHGDREEGSSGAGTVANAKAGGAKADGAAADRDWICSWCRTSFERRQGLREHRKAQSCEAVAFRCQEPGCLRSFPAKHRLVSHRRAAHDGWRDWPCQEPGCGEVFPLKKALIEHQNIANHELVAGNVVVGKKREGPAEYLPGRKRVRYSEGGERAGKIEPVQAERSVRSAGDIKAGVTKGENATREDGGRLLSTGEWKCDKAGCGKVFPRRDVWRLHKRSHGVVPQKAGRGKLICAEPGCGKKFTKRANMLSHQRSAHIGVRDWNCKVEGCGQVFRFKSKLTEHHDAVHISQIPVISPPEMTVRRLTDLPARKRGRYALLEPQVSLPEPVLDSAKDQAEAERPLPSSSSPFRRPNTGFTSSAVSGVTSAGGESAGKVWMCEEPGCEETFTRRTERIAHHTMVHRGPLDWKCEKPGCGKAFPSDHSRISHQRFGHIGWRCWKCDEPGCGKAFRLKKELAKHQEACHQAVQVDSSAASQKRNSAAGSTPGPGFDVVGSEELIRVKRAVDAARGPSGTFMVEDVILQLSGADAVDGSGSDYLSMAQINAGFLEMVAADLLVPSDLVLSSK